MQDNRQYDLVVIGGGPAGFMGAITAAEHGVKSVLILEAGTKNLDKVRISGGGRCNVTHACWEPSELVPNYPRGQIALLGAFSHFATGDAYNWFESRGLELIIESDGRMFPKSNSSIDVINCLTKAAKISGVSSLKKKLVKQIKSLTVDGFSIECKDGSIFFAKKVLIATGGHPSGSLLAISLGHKFIPSNPSLFSFKIRSPWMKNCQGISVDNVSLKLFIDNNLFKEKGRILITHNGLSGPAILKLSAFASRKLYDSKYKASLQINWTDNTKESVQKIIRDHSNEYQRYKIFNKKPFNTIPRRLWISFLNQIDILPETKWSGLSKKEENKLTEFLINNSNLIIGKGPYGEEFVTSGGVSLDEINFKSMESRICDGLYFAGEILDIDGITGGFNFQNCWTSGWIAGKAISK